MTHVVWLASYPKSGNTWLRAFLANYLHAKGEPFEINRLPQFSYGDMRIEFYEKVSGRPAAELSEREINRLRPKVHRAFANARPGTVFVKTHSVLAAADGIPTITPDVTLGAIYVVRNPLDVAVSYSHHNRVSLDDAIEVLGFRDFRVPAARGQIPQFVCDWSTHVRSWRTAPGLYLKLIRYEDMLANPATTFGGVIDFLRLRRDRRQLKRAIRFSAFVSLAGQERRSGFRERPEPAERFFRAGRAGGWREALSAEQVRRIVDRHREQMSELGYLAASGEILG